MNPPNQLTIPATKTSRRKRQQCFVLFALALPWFALLPAARAAEGDLGNGNTAEGDSALISLTGGVDNTALGSQALTSNTGGTYNTAVGSLALIKNQTGDANTATGYDSLGSNTAGKFNTATGFEALVYNAADDNTAIGFQALFSNTTGTINTAAGLEALGSNITGRYNTAAGGDALQSNTSGSRNTAAGFEALLSNTSGNDNIALGSSAGSNLTTGSNNINIGALGTADEANTIRIGKQGTQKTTFIAGISGVAVSGSAVLVNSNGKLGVATSSIRFKDNIKPMDKASEAILALKPVSFCYKEEVDPDGTPQFGLIAEEVEKVNPDLVARDEEGKVNTVRYDAVNAMLLNEFLKEHRTVQELKATVVQQQAANAQRQARIEKQQKQIEMLTNKLQKVSDRLDLSAFTSRGVSRDQ